MIKSLIPALSKEVGRSTALVFQQLLQWFKNNDVVYRTNQEISEDLEGILSVTTVQRAKKKLIESGYLTVSFDKGYKRTTHYRLTEKAISFVNTWKEAAVEKVEKAKKVIKGVGQIFGTHSKTQRKAHTGGSSDSGYGSTSNTAIKPKTPQKDDSGLGLAATKSMKEAFNSYGKAPEGRTVMPDFLRNLGHKKSAPIEKGTDTENSVASLLGSVFKKGVTTAQEEIFKMKEDVGNFSEDY